MPREATLVRDRRAGRWVYYSLGDGALDEARAHLEGLVRHARGAAAARDAGSRDEASAS